MDRYKKGNTVRSFELLLSLSPKTSSGHSRQPWTAYPLFALLFCCNSSEEIPIAFLKRLCGLNPRALYELVRAPNGKLATIVSCVTQYCKCRNKSEVAMFVISRYFRPNSEPMKEYRRKAHRRLGESTLLSAVIRRFSDEVISTLIQKELELCPPDLLKKRLDLALKTALGPGDAEGRYPSSVVESLLRHTDSLYIDCDSRYEPDGWHDNLLTSSLLNTRRSIEFRIGRDDRVDAVGEIDGDDEYGYIFLEPSISILENMPENHVLSSLCIVASEDLLDEFCDEVSRFLSRCTALRMLRVSCAFSHRTFDISSLTNLDELTLNNIFLSPQSLHSTLSTAENISLDRCRMLQDQTRTLEVQPDFLEAWGRALRQNPRIRQFQMIHIGFEVQEPEGVDEFVEALSTRSTLEKLTLTCSEPNAPRLDRFELTWEASHMRKFGSMGSLQHLQIDNMGRGPGVLQALLSPRPRNLRSLKVEKDSIFVSNIDWRELLDFLSDPDCKIEGIPTLRFDDNWNNTSIDERFRSLVDVLKDKNTSVRRPIDIAGTMTLHYQRALAFWCLMNKQCPNRLKLRHAGLTFALADEIVELERKNENSRDPLFGKSAIHALVMSTFQNWAGG